MKITREALKNIVKETMIEENEYQEFFKKALEKAGKSIPSMSDEEKKAFFNNIEKTWKGRGAKKESVSELTDAQKKLPPALQKAIEKKEDKKESVNEDYNGPAILKLGNKNLLKVGEKITINTNGKKKEYKVVKSVGNGDFVLNVVESINEGASTEEKRIAMLAVRKQAKYRSVDLATAIRDQIRALEELERDVKKGKIKK